MIECPRCKSKENYTKKGTPPHHMGIFCKKCNRWLKWTKKPVVKKETYEINRDPVQPKDPRNWLFGRRHVR